MKKIINLLLILLISASLFAEEKEIIPGVTLERMSVYKGEKQNINIARIDLTRDYIHIGVGLGDRNKFVNDKPYGKEKVSTIVEKNNALLGVNGDYFIMEAFRDNLNFSLIKGEIISEPQFNRSVMMINSDNHIYFDYPHLRTMAYLNDGTMFNITGINRNRNAGDTILYTDKFAPSTLNKYNAYDVVLRPVFGENPRPNSEITYQVENILPNSCNNIIEQGKVIISSTLKTCPNLYKLKVGDIISIKYELETSEDASKLLYAIGGGPMLVKNGEIYITSKSENFKNDIAVGRAPRTCVGVNSDNSVLYLVTVDGRCDESKGMDLNALAFFMKDLGVYNGMNLDGGGSTSMSILGLVMNKPSEVIERNVANALLVFADYEGRNLVPYKDYTDTVFRGNNSYALDETLKNMVWGTNQGVGFVNDKNVLMTSNKDRKGKIGFVFDGKKYDYNVEITNAPLDRIELEATRDGNAYNCVAKLIDNNNRLMSFSPIYIYVENGSIERSRFVSDEKGEVKFQVTFDENIVENTEENNDGLIDFDNPNVKKNIIRFVFGNFNQCFEL